MALYEITPTNMQGSGFFFKGRAGENMLRGKLVYKGADGAWYLADADLAATTPALGLTMGRANAGQIVRILKEGYIGRGDWAWVVGGQMYASGTPGELTQVAAGLVQVVGMATRPDMISFDPEGSVGAGGVVCALLEGAAAYVGFDVCKGTNYANYFTATGVNDHIPLQAAIDAGGTDSRVHVEQGTYALGANMITIDYDDIHVDFEKGTLLTYTGAGVALLMGSTVGNNRRITVSYPSVWAQGAGSTAIQLTCKESLLLNPRIIGNTTGISLLFKPFTAGHDDVFENTIINPIIQSGQFGVKLEKNGARQNNANQIFGGKISCSAIAASIAIWVNGDNGAATNTFEGISISSATTGIEVEINNPLNWFRSIRDEIVTTSVNCVGNRNVFRDNSFQGAVTVAGDYNVLRHNVIVGALTISADTDVPEVFTVVTDPDSNVGDHPALVLPDTVDTTFRFQVPVPNEFQALVTAQVIMLQTATGGPPDMQWSTTTDWGKLCAGENYNAGSDAETDQTTAVAQNELVCIDVSASLTGIDAGDLVGFTFIRRASQAGDTINSDAHYLGFKLRYV